MKQLWVVCLAVALLAGRASAQDDPLPESVARAYQIYETALAAEEFTAASQAAEQAFAAARVSGLSDDLQLTLGLNALAMAPSRGTGNGLVELTRATAELADGLGDRETGFEAWLRGLWGASSSRNYVAFDLLYADLLTLTAENDNGYADWMVSLGRIDSPRYLPAFGTPEERAAGQVELARAREAGNPYRLANAAIRLQRDDMTGEDFAGALDVTLAALGQLAEAGAGWQAARDAVMVSLSDILRDGYASTDSGEAHLSGEARVAWCDYLARRAVALDYITETRTPTRAIERSLQGVVRTEFSVPAGGGLPELGESRASSRQIGLLLRASRNHLAQTHFRPACAGQTSSSDGVLLEGFGIVTAERRGRVARFCARVFSIFTE